MAAKKNYNSDGRSAEDRTLDKFAELLIEKLETIQADWKKPWFTEGVTASLPKNLSGREYNGMNSMMLMLHAEKEGFKMPVWATFDRITGLNYVKDKQGVKHEAKDSEGNNLPLVSVNKGAKSFPVFITTFTVVDKETKEKIKYDDYRQMTEQDRERYNVYPKLSVYNVFNVEGQSVYNVFNVEGQTNLKEARPELFKKLQEQNEVNRPVQQEGEMFSFPAIDHMIAENKWICPIKPTYGDSAYYSISKNEIVIPEKKQFKNGESFYSNLAHEMGHSTGAENQLNRLKPSAFGSKEYAREELVAEMSAALVSQRYGMSKTLKEDSLPYLKGWLNSLKEEPAFIKTVLQDVKKASGMINQAKEVKQETANQVSDNYGSYDIPKWALPYIMNGDASGISDHEQELVDKFLEKNFPDGFIPEVEEGEGKELNRYPAFGERNENALTDRGESPYLAVDTVSVKFSPGGYMETVSDDKEDGRSQEAATDNPKERLAAKAIPQPEEQQEEVHFHRGR